MITAYIQEALKKAEYKKMDDGTWFASVTELQGVWSAGTTIEECRKELAEVIEEWLLFQIRDHETLPDLNGIHIDLSTTIAV